MFTKLTSIEDCLKTIMYGVNDPNGIQINTHHDQILLSFGKQVARGTGLTDKQTMLAKARILTYKSEFEKLGIMNLEEIVEINDLGIRVIERLKTITISDTAPLTDTSSKAWIKIKFPFNKKTMALLAEITATIPRDLEYRHQRGSNEHYIKLNEKNVDRIITVFGKKEFYVDPELVTMYETICNIKANPDQHVPGIYKDQLKNIPDAAVKQIVNDLGPLDHKTRLVYRDRSIKYGISHYDYETPGFSIAEKIALRKNTEVLIHPDVDFASVISGLVDLKRDPILVLINESGTGHDILAETKKIYTEFSKFYSNSEQSVLFRVDSVPNVYTINEFVKDNSLNNWVDEKTKVVYIKKTRLPKLLVSGTWKPATSLSLTSDTSSSLVKEYVKYHCDLVLYQDTYITNMSKMHQKATIDVIM